MTKDLIVLLAHGSSIYRFLEVRQLLEFNG